MVQELIARVLAAGGVRVHSVAYRIKSQDSVLRKLKSSTTRRNMESLTDLLGFRVITYFPDDVDRAAKIIRQEFLIDEENSIDKRDVLDPDRFGYLSMHYIAKLDAKRASLTEYAAYTKIFFEIQIRSILQHAWAEIEHDLGYKSQAAVPRSVRRDFSRLAGLLELADNEFVRIRDDLNAAESTVAAEIRSGEQDIEVDQASVFAFISTSTQYHALELHISGCFNVELGPPDASMVGRTVPRLLAVGIRKISDLNQVLTSEYGLLALFSHLWVTDDYPEATPEDIDDNSISQGIGLFYIYLFMAAKMLVNGDPGSIAAESLKGFSGRVARQLTSAYAEAMKRLK
jgi:putative GTP pyrophosphokinase